jgi:hypothetical protein
MAKPPNRTPSKIRPVQISLMRTPPALVTQREFRKAHGDRIAAELDLNKLALPIVNHRDGIYWILDGQHRIYAMRQNGFSDDFIECQVYENLTDAESADLFIGVNDRKQVPAFDKFHLACTANYQRETSIRRAVESNGQKISRERDDGISAVAALGKVYDKSGDVVLGQVIRTINLGFGGDPLGFDRSVIEGLGLVYNRYNGRTNEKAMGSRLSGLKQGARELLRKAEAVRERTGNQKTHCVAAVIVETYNKAETPSSKNRLSSWWKETD